MKRVKRYEHWRLDAGLWGWIVKYAQRNHWRVASFYTLEDLIQEGLECYARCHRKYPHVKVQKHFMALVQKAFMNHVTNLARNRTKAVPETLLPQDDPLFIGQMEPGDAFFQTLIHQLPTELQRLLQILMDDAKNIPMLRFADGTRETTNEYLCRLLNLDPQVVDVEAVFREHL